jgi:hypothetical protein
MSGTRIRRQGKGVPNKALQLRANDPKIIAPCGVNCSLCRAYIRDRKPCPGCRGGDSHKSNACLTCAIRNCRELAAGGHRFCFSCDNFPCANLLHLEGRYQAQYGVSVIANLERIKAVGVERFVAEEEARWSCPECGSLLCMHRPQCPACGHAWRGND